MRRSCSPNRSSDDVGAEQESQIVERQRIDAVEPRPDGQRVPVEPQRQHACCSSQSADSAVVSRSTSSSSVSECSLRDGQLTAIERVGGSAAASVPTGGGSASRIGACGRPSAKRRERVRLRLDESAGGLASVVAPDRR